MTQDEIFKLLDSEDIEYELIADHGDGMHILVAYEEEEEYDE